MLRRCPDCGAAGTPLLAGADRSAAPVCPRCRLRRDLDRIVPPDQPGQLRGLRPALLAGDQLPTRRWLARNAALLVDLNTAPDPITHAALDDLPAGLAIDYLRALLVATGVLPADPDRPLRELAAEVRAVADRVGADGLVVAAWIRWSVMPRLRRPGRAGAALAGRVHRARVVLAQTERFLTGLRHAGRQLLDCSQADIDRWFAGPGAARHTVQPFLRWARTANHLPRQLRLPPAYRGHPEPAADPAQRWRLARQLLSDDTLDTADRVAAALLVLYAQPLTRILSLTVDDVVRTGNDTYLLLGPDPLHLPEQLAALVRQLPHHRRHGLAEMAPRSWLFPGGSPGRPLTDTILRKRLRALGIRPRQMRLAAQDQLARDVSPALLAGVLGVGTRTTARWNTQAGGDYARYTASPR